MGLFLGFLGDLFLVGTSQHLFLAGLVSFLLGHVAYVFAFYSLLDTTSLGFASSSHLALNLGILFAFSFCVYTFYLSPHVKSLKVAVLCYVSVITLMVAMALLVLHNSELGKAEQQQKVLLGAVLFFFSDLGVARQQFVTSSSWNKIVCLPAYYAAQIILAFTIGVFGDC